MLNTLKVHLSTAASPELQAAVEEACDWFDHFELPGWQLLYEELLFTLDNNELNDNVAAIAELTLDLQHILLNNFQIQVTAEASISRLNKIIRCLRDLESTEMADDVLAICSEQGDCVEVFSAILSLMTAEPAETYYECLTSVGQALIQRISETIQKLSLVENHDDVIDVTGDRKRVDRLKKFMVNAGVETTKVLSLILNGVKLGLSFEDYYIEIVDGASPQHPEQTAIELYAASICSSDACEKPRDVVLKALNRTYSSLDIITPLLIAFDAVSLKNHIAETSGVKEVK